MSVETITQELKDLDAHKSIRGNLPEECRGCRFAENQVDQLGWVVDLGRLTSERAAELVLERTGCSTGVALISSVTLVAESI